MGVLNLILKGVKEPSEPERGAKAHEVRRSAEFLKSVYHQASIYFKLEHW